MEQQPGSPQPASGALAALVEQYQAVYGAQGDDELDTSKVMTVCVSVVDAKPPP